MKALNAINYSRKRLNHTCLKNVHQIDKINLIGTKITRNDDNNTVRKMSKYGVNSGPYFPEFGLNKEIYGVNLRIQPEYRKIRTRCNSIFGHFSRSGNEWVNESKFCCLI